jgi:hypothetical protein
MHASENFSEYFARLLVICNQMKRYREKIKETRLVEKTYVCCKKKVPLYDGRDREVTKYGCYFNPRSYSKSTSP